MEVDGPGNGCGCVGMGDFLLDVILSHHVIADDSAAFALSSAGGDPVDSSSGPFLSARRTVFDPGPVCKSGHEGIIADVFIFFGLIAVLARFGFPVSAGEVVGVGVVEFDSPVDIGEGDTVVFLHAGPEHGKAHDFIAGFFRGEGFMEDAKGWLNNLKLRASWGLLGNQDALDDYYPSKNTYQVDATYPFNGTLNSGYYQSEYKLESITWEKSRTWGVGIDATINNKINVTVDYYDKKTTGIIMDVSVPEEFRLDPYKDNVGAMSNRGVELILSYNNRWGDWSFGATGNVSYNKNKILDLGGVESMADPNNSNKNRKVGEAINSYYMYRTAGLFESDEAAQAWMDQYADQDGYPFGTAEFKGGDVIIVDVNGDGKITSDDRDFCGSSDPSWTYGLNLNVGWKGFDLSMLFTGAAGGHIYLTTDGLGYFKGDDSHPASVWQDAWTPENTDATMPRIAYDENSPSIAYTTDFWLQNTSYVRMKNLQLGYTFPKNWLEKLRVQNLRVYYSAENLFTLDNMLINADPETTVERVSNYPLSRTHSFGINVTF